MPDWLTYTVDAGELGDLELAWDASRLRWTPPDRSVGETAGFWEGTPKLVGGDLGYLSLSAVQVETLWMGMMTPGLTAEETRRRARAALARHAEDLLEELGPPGSDEDERAAA